jgi:hypothetical protein
MALDDLAEYFDTYPKTGCGIIDSFTVDNQSIADVTDFFRAVIFLQDLLDLEPGS